MPNSPHLVRSEYIELLERQVRQIVPSDEAAIAFVSDLYGYVALRDLSHENPEDLVGAALSLWRFGKNRGPGGAKVRAFKPRMDYDGWQSPHTVIEIVNDDMPFLVDSVCLALARLDLELHLVLHPIIRLQRDAEGQRIESSGRVGGDGPPVIAESYMHLKVSERSSRDELAAIEAELQSVLEEVRIAVEDWPAMRGRMLDVVAEVEVDISTAADDDLAEICRFLHWVVDDHFTFLGYREFEYVGVAGDETHMQVVHGSGLGVLRDPDYRVFEDIRNLQALPEDVRAFLLKPEGLLITKTDRMARVHRSVHYDLIGVKKLNDIGRVVGEHRFIGAFTSAAYNQSPRQIPLLRLKVDNVMTSAGFQPSSHDGKMLLNVLETYPRDELFQSASAELLENAVGMLHVQQGHRVAVFTRIDALERFASCIVFVPRDRFDSGLRRRITGMLCQTFAGTLSIYYTQMTDAPVVRLHVIIKITRGEIPEFDRDALERHLTDICRSWDDKLHESAIETKGEEAGSRLYRQFGIGFPSSYRESHGVQTAILDMEHMRQVVENAAPAMTLFRPVSADNSVLRLKLFNRLEPAPLSDVIPILENLGVKVISEVPYEVRLEDFDVSVWIHDFEMVLRGGAECDLGRIKLPCEDALRAIWDGRLENDGFNGLVLAAGMTWREVTVIRAYARYLRQTTFTFSQSYMEETLVANAGIARLLADLFLCRFDPAADNRDQNSVYLVGRIEQALETVANLDEDRILRRFLNLINATLRTNFFRRHTGKTDDSCLSFKFDSQAIDDLPLPRPLVEIWLYAPRVEAVHLRGGRIARGGIRWSDRREDFRTEVLGLMKAQMSKNAVIVPTGSKGGFIVKRPPVGGTRDELQAEGVACYQTMIRGMLDLTDNIRGPEIIPPPDVVRHDGDDPYLVVAADKGTAAFSDYANAVSLEYGFWLGDAFASGGSAGYDHKKMGITAKGAWESVKRHFRECETDIQTTDFTVVGCGDMSGDVFGNGILLSKHIRLLGAFNHRHIFIDPDPDAAIGWSERKRLFDLPRSSWSDYDSTLITTGGGVFDRSAKTIALTSEIKALTGIESDNVTPSQLIRALLTAEVDLLWFGGIGTYVKCREESSADVGDRANDAHRINGDEVRARVVGEGANLGVTQRGRIEYARAGGRINTDAIDNCAGVACSDHEVNIKILLGSVVAEGDLTVKQRDELLNEMTDAVAELVLTNNYDQSQAITVAQHRGAGLLDAEARLIRQLERGALRLDRMIECLPGEESLAERIAAGGRLERPEIAILLAYAKMELYDELLPSGLPDDPTLDADLQKYFPDILNDRFPDAVSQHRLRREIVTSYIVNSMINRVGATFVNTVREQTGDQAIDIARAYLIARDIFEIRTLWGQVEDLDNMVPAAVQIRMLDEIRQLVERGSVWLLRNEVRPLDLAAITSKYAPGIRTLRASLDQTANEFQRQSMSVNASTLAQDGVPSALAQSVAGTSLMVSGLDVARLADRLARPVTGVAQVYFAIGEYFALDWLRDRAAALAVENRWQQLAVATIVDDLLGHQIAFTSAVLGSGGESGVSMPDAVARVIEKWTTKRREATSQTMRLLLECRAVETVDLPMLAVANGQFRALLSNS